MMERAKVTNTPDRHTPSPSRHAIFRHGAMRWPLGMSTAWGKKQSAAFSSRYRPMLKIWETTGMGNGFRKPHIVMGTKSDGSFVAAKVLILAK